MLRHISKTVGSAMATLCLVSTLAMAQSQSPSPPMPPSQTPAVSERQSQYPSERQAQHMTCIKDDGMGNCTAATGADGKDMIVVGTGLRRGDAMSCLDMRGVVQCKPAS